MNGPDPSPAVQPGGTQTAGAAASIVGLWIVAYRRSRLFVAKVTTKMMALRKTLTDY
jgi:hypothetical protein